MKKVIVIVIFVAIIAYAAYWLKTEISKMEVEPVEFDVTKIDIKNRTAEAYTTIEITNPFTDVKLTNLFIDVAINGVQLAKTSQKVLTPIYDKGRLYFTIYFDLDFSKLNLNDAITLLSKGDKKYSLKGSVKASKWGVSYDVPIDFEDKFYLIN
jgi:LEA14-like dessication related protein